MRESELEEKVDELPDWLLGEGEGDFSEKDAEKWINRIEDSNSFSTPDVICEKCHKLAELYERTPQEPRDYWLMTEIFVMLHGGDVCEEGYDANQSD